MKIKYLTLLPIYSYEEQSLDVDRLYPEILSSKITKKHATSDQSDEVRLSEAVGN